MNTPCELRRDSLLSTISTEENIVNILKLRALHQPDVLAYTFLSDGEKEEVFITYGQLDLKARTVATSLQQLVLPGDRALLIYPSGLESIIAFFGCLYAGVVAVPVYPPRRNQKLLRLQKVVSDAQAKICLSNNNTFNEVQKQLEYFPVIKNCDWLVTDNIDIGRNIKWNEPQISLNNVAFLQYTSGSTGNPKGVIVTHKNIISNSEYIRTAFQLDRHSVSVSWLPVFHDMGLIDGIIQPLFSGFHGVIMPPNTFVAKPVRWLKAISHYKATHCGGPNFGYDLCVSKITTEERNMLDLSSWRSAYNGAEPIRHQTINNFSKLFASCGFETEFFFPCYGMAENTLMVSGGKVEEQPVYLNVDGSALEENRVVCVPHTEPTSRTLVGCGCVWLDTKIVIVDPNTNIQVAPDCVGEIWVSSLSVAQGYWGNLKATEETFRAYIADTGDGPFLRTGDLGFIKDGEIFVTGRRKDLIIVRGRNYYPQDIELSVEQSHSSLSPNCSAAFSIEVDGEQKLVVVQEVKREYFRKIDVEKISQLARRSIASEYELQLYDLVLLKPLSIPKTSSGKVQRSLCRQKYLNNNFRKLESKMQFDLLDGKSEVSVSKPNSEDIIETWLKGWICNRVNIDIAKISSTSQFIDYGLDSVQTAELATEVEQFSGIRLAEGVLFIYPTIEQLSKHLISRLGENIDQAISRLLENNGKRENFKSVPNTIFHSITEIEPKHYKFEHIPEYLDQNERFSMYHSGDLNYPYFKPKEQVSTSTIHIQGQEYINYSTFDYLGFASHPEVIKSSQLAVEKYGTSVSASRIVAGETPLHQELEATLASWLGTDDSIVFTSGHGTNVYTISSVVGANDLIVHDQSMHNSALLGSQLSGATMISFPHNDWQTLEAILAEKRLKYSRVLILIEGVYSMDGDIPDLPKFVEIKKRYKAWLLVDEAHSIGVLGQTGRGIGEYYEVDREDVDIWMGTLSKAFASCGGYIAGCKALVDYLRHSNPGFLFSTGIAPSNVASALKAVQKIHEKPQRVSKLRERSEFFLKLAKEKGLNTGLSQNSPVIPILVGDMDRAAKLADTIYKKRINVFAIGYPAVGMNEARLRFFISALHTEEQIRYTVETIAELLPA